MLGANVWSPLRAVLLGAAAAAALLYGCHDATEPPGADQASGPASVTATDVDVEKIVLSYVCGTRFSARNENAGDVAVTYQVIGTAEQGNLTLPTPVAPATFSETFFETQNVGTVQLLYSGAVIEETTNQGTPCAPPPEATMGQWGPVIPWPVVAVHGSLLPTGKVLSWGRGGVPYLWDPAFPDVFTAKWSPSNIFCAGHALLPDGRLLVVGGHISDYRGLPNTNIFDPVTETWQVMPPMTRARWYPTVTILGSGEAMVLGGSDENAVYVDVPEAWSGTWRTLSTAVLTFPYYPRAFLAPNAYVFYAGELKRSRFLNPTGTGSWRYSATSNYGNRSYGTAVMYDYGKILILGGNSTPTNTAEKIDLLAATPTWSYTSPMAYARRNLNAVVLPDGTVLALGGTSGTGFNNLTGSVLAAELWNPATGTWTTLASHVTRRVYHSTALLLPDGRVLHTGSGDASPAPNERNAEIYSPPYLFNGPRPTITSAPDAVPYNSTAFVATPDAATITKVSWIRLGSVTHAFDENQRFITMAFTKVTGGINVKTNKGRSALPPGHYMMFLLNASGVPSVAKIIGIG